MLESLEQASPLLYTSTYNMPLSEMKAKQNFICRLHLMNIVASIGGSFQWTDSMRHSSTSDESTLLKERHGSVLDTSFPITMLSAQAGPKHCPPLSCVFTGRQDILSQMHTYFSTNFRKPHVFILHILVSQDVSVTSIPCPLHKLTALGLSSSHSW
jgi:hypothetical protein